MLVQNLHVRFAVFALADVLDGVKSLLADRWIGLKALAPSRPVLDLLPGGELGVALFGVGEPFFMVFKGAAGVEFGEEPLGGGWEEGEGCAEAGLEIVSGGCLRFGPA